MSDRSEEPLTESRDSQYLRVRPSAGSDPLFESDRHALYCGWVVGIIMKHGFDMSIVTDEHGNYTDRFVIRLKPYAEITVVVPPPPDDWMPSDE